MRREARRAQYVLGATLKESVKGIIEAGALKGGLTTPAGRALAVQLSGPLQIRH
jgi:hypothetical protein